MTALKTSIELIVCIALIIGFCHEKQIAEWEFKQRKKIKLAILRTARRLLLPRGAVPPVNVKVLTHSEHNQLHKMGSYKIIDLNDSEVFAVPKER